MGVNSLIPGYKKEWLRLDVLAGLTTAAVVIPKAMADLIRKGRYADEIM